MQIKTMRYPLIPVRMASIKKTDKQKCQPVCTENYVRLSWGMKRKIKDESPASAFCSPGYVNLLNRRPRGIEAAEATPGWSRFKASPAGFTGGDSSIKNGGFAVFADGL